jgi:osmotically inducible protein OsmC
MIRKSMTQWQGDGPSGSGSLTTESGALRAQPYSFKTRFQSGQDMAKMNCPVSKALSATPISLAARLA